MKRLEEIERVKEEVEDALLELPGVTGVDVGRKYVGGVKTDVLAIRVYVQEKRDVPKADSVPEQIQGIPTDVVERRFVLHIDGGEGSRRDDRQSVGHERREVMKTIAEMKPVKEAREEELLHIPGVTGVDIGRKFVGGDKTDELAIRVYVAEKKPLDDIPEGEQIPKSIEGIKTDVVQRRFVLHPLMMRVADMRLLSDTANYDPLRGGISIGPCRSVFMDVADAACQGAPGPGWYQFVGTLGCIVIDNTTKNRMLLSNFHVMCVDDAWQVGDAMAQPGIPDGGACPTNVVGTLQRAALTAHVDASVASHTARGYQCSIVDVGYVTGTAVASVGMDVRKRGRTTGLTYGTVDSLNLTVSIPYCNGLGTRTLTNQILIEVDESRSPQFGAGGDSGSVVVDENGKVVGLYFAGDDSGMVGVANPINDVLTALDVSICSLVKKREPDTTIKKQEYEPMPKKQEYEPMPKKQEYEPMPKKQEYEPIKGAREPIKGGMEPVMPGAPPIGPDPLEERISRIEAALAQLTHFIAPESRPEGGKSPLMYESESGPC